MKVIKMTPNKTVLFRARLLSKVDKKLREMVYRRGELVTLIVFMINTVDLTKIPLLEISSEVEQLSATTVKLPADEASCSQKKQYDERSAK
jgi:hypothetical protein